jgi:hypothetical protein
VVTRRAARWLAAAACVLAPAAARADDSAARVEALVAEARTLTAEGRTSEACARLDEAVRLRPEVDLTTRLAECHERAGQVASALRAWQAVERSDALAAGDARAAAARERRIALEAVAPKLVIEGPARGGGAIEVRRDGAVVARAQWGAAILVDPGEHVVTATAPGKRSWYTTVKSFPNGATLSVAVPELEDALVPPAPPRAVQLKRQTVFDESVGKPKGDSQRLVGVGLGVVAVVALGIGTVYGLQAKLSLDESNTYCQGNACESIIGVEKRQDAKDAAAVSTLAVGIGVGAAVGGLLLYFFAPRDEAAKRAASPFFRTW